MNSFEDDLVLLDLPKDNLRSLDTISSDLFLDEPVTNSIDMQDYSICEDSFVFKNSMNIFKKLDNIQNSQKISHSILGGKRLLVITTSVLAQAKIVLGEQATPINIFIKIACLQGMNPNLLWDVPVLRDAKKAQSLFKYLAQSVFEQGSFAWEYYGIIFLNNNHDRICDDYTLLYNDFMTVHEAGHFADYRLERTVKGKELEAYAKDYSSTRHKQESFVESMAFLWLVNLYGLAKAKDTFVKFRFKFISPLLPQEPEEPESRFWSPGNSNRGVYCVMNAVENLISWVEKIQLAECPILFQSLTSINLTRSLLSKKQLQQVSDLDLPDIILKNIFYASMQEEYILARNKINKQLSYQTVNIPVEILKNSCPLESYQKFWSAEAYLNKNEQRFDSAQKFEFLKQIKNQFVNKYMIVVDKF